MGYTMKASKDNKVRYMMKQKDGTIVRADTRMTDAMKLLSKGQVHASSEFDGYCITADNIHFFEGIFYDDETPVEKPVKASEATKDRGYDRRKNKTKIAN